VQNLSKYHVAQQQPSSCGPPCPGHTVLDALESNGPYSPDLSLCDFNEFDPLKKVLKGRRRQGCGGAMVPAAAQVVLCGGDPWAGVPMGCLPQCP
jgi:hypothetical protein